MGRGRHETLAGSRVYVEEWGHGPTLLCLHGLGNHPGGFWTVFTLVVTVAAAGAIVALRRSRTP